MKSGKYRIKELTFFKNGCDIDFLRSLRYYRCYVTEDGTYIAVMQFENTYQLVLGDVAMLQKDGTVKNTILTQVAVQLDKKYSLYELAE